MLNFFQLWITIIIKRIDLSKLKKCIIQWYSWKKLWFCYYSKQGSKKCKRNNNGHNKIFYHKRTTTVLILRTKTHSSSFLELSRKCYHFAFFVFLFYLSFCKGQVCVHSFENSNTVVAFVWRVSITGCGNK